MLTFIAKTTIVKIRPKQVPANIPALTIHFAQRLAFKDIYSCTARAMEKRELNLIRLRYCSPREKMSYKRVISSLLTMTLGFFRLAKINFMSIAFATSLGCVAKVFTGTGLIREMLYSEKKLS